MLGRYISFINRWYGTIIVFQCQCGLLRFSGGNFILSGIMCCGYIFNGRCIIML